MTGAELDTLVAQRESGRPLEHVLGWAEFCGLRVRVGDGVFVPRPRSQLLARTAVEHARADAAPVVVDLCCGAGAFGAVVAAEVPGAEVHAVDLSPAAVHFARLNVGPTGGTVYCGDLYDPLPPDLAGRVTVIAANAPYVPTGRIPFLPPEARDFEPATALDGGADGLDVLRRVVAGAPDWLAPGGVLIAECADAQAATLLAAAASAGLRAETRSDEGLGATILVGRGAPRTAG